MLGYPFRTIGKDGGDLTLARPQNGQAFLDPSPIAGRGWPPSPALLFLTKSGDIHKTSISGENGTPSMLYLFVITQFRTQNRFPLLPELL